MRLRCATMLALFAWSGLAGAQDDRAAGASRGDLRAAWSETSDVAGRLREELASLPIAAPGWTCEDGASGRGPSVLDAIPLARLDCRHEEQALRLTLMLDPGTASLYCADVEGTRQGIATGTVNPRLFRFFESDTWQIKRASVDLSGCAAGVLALRAEGLRSEAAVARGPAAIDAFAEALLDVDPGPILEAYAASGHAAALNRTVSLLEAESERLAALIPARSGFARDAAPRGAPILTTLPRHLPTVLWTFPQASGRLEADGCQVDVLLSAAPALLSEALVSRQWGVRRGRDGETSDLIAYVRRETDRFVGREAKDGSGIRALVDDAVVVSVSLPGGRPCEGHPSIVSALFQDILRHDLSSFGVGAMP